LHQRSPVSCFPSKIVEGGQTDLHRLRFAMQFLAQGLRIIGSENTLTAKTKFRHPAGFFGKNAQSMDHWLRYHFEAGNLLVMGVLPRQTR
jgi:hypothetical protein